MCLPHLEVYDKINYDFIVKFIVNFYVCLNDVKLIY